MEREGNVCIGGPAVGQPRHVMWATSDVICRAGIPRRTGDAGKRANRFAGRSLKRAKYTAVVAGRIATGRLHSATGVATGVAEPALRHIRKVAAGVTIAITHPSLRVAADKKAIAMLGWSS